ncbi:Fpg/Nei family DNA glycosylase [Gramella sp. KN1008]|uniref:Fpg/Nei family DNA glycosylase n=1 Tax=Gramella sp. KN1008 TaxID=2529298 RepID=UPI001038D020|nr:DNA-formamidopyrimidine glycosylase family protein [Gramella sp. KN1008]TBW29999.1 formamidopyrimidine-DNA glycosylase [Gramella sp. KN1008]
MPELPEVTYYKKYVDATSLHKKIQMVGMSTAEILQAPKKEFEDRLVGTELVQAQRHGKYLFIKTSDDGFLVFHFGMTGKFDFSHEDDPPKHTRFYLTFEDSSKLFFICPRKLGKIYLAQEMEDFLEEHSVGKDALEIDKSEFRELLDKKRGSIKGALTNQSLIAGIGNMYADEILFQTKIHPKTAVSDLSEKELDKIFNKMEEVLETLIESKEKEDGLPDTYLTGNREEGSDCPVCKGKIKMIKVSGRSTYFCPSCQKEK